MDFKITKKFKNIDNKIENFTRGPETTKIQTNWNSVTEEALALQTQQMGITADLLKPKEQISKPERTR